MLQDMRNSSVIRRIRLEPDGEDIVGVVARNVEVVGASLIMLELESSEFQLRNLLNAL
jgi:hypothetical protein